MRELVRTNDPVLVSAIEALLDGAGIPHVVARPEYQRARRLARLLPRRILVADDRIDEARSCCEDAGLGHELRPECADDQRT